MKAIKKIALCLAVLFVMQAMPIGVFAVSFKDALSEDSRGISVLAHYVKEDAGRAGMLYVNEYNQETIVKRSDASIMSDDAQLELIYYYSSYENGYSSHSPYGNHWKTNYDIKLQYDAENDQFIYLHNDGATVAFEKTDEMQGGDIYWKEKLTMLCRLDKLYVKQNSTNPADARIETKKGETLTFDSEGRLVRIKTQQSDVQISYHLNGISEISDAAGNRLQFNYGNDNRVETITGYQGKTPILIEKGEKNVPYQIQYQYDIKGRLISVTYPDGKSISYGYLFPDKLSTIQNIDEKCLEIAYAQKRAETIQQISSENPALSRDIASLKHNSNGNIIKSELFGETTYQYNEYGLLVYDDKTMAAIDKEAREVELASEKATVERVRPCNCEVASHTGLAPKTDTPVVRMAKFIAEVSEKKPFIRRIYPQVRAMFEGLCPYMAFPMRLIFANLWLFAPLLKTLMPKINPMAGAMLGTMCSFNTINGGKYGSVQAKTVEAGAYLRCIDDKDLAQDIAAFRTIAEKYGVEVTDGEGNEYHAPADLGKPAYDYVRECVADVFPHVACAPFILPAGTDARWLTDVCQCVIRFAPIDIDPQQFASVHSPDENIDIKAVGNAIAFYKRLLREYH